MSANFGGRAMQVGMMVGLYSRVSAKNIFLVTTPPFPVHNRRTLAVTRCESTTFPCSNPDLTHFRSRDVIHFAIFRLSVRGFLTESGVCLAKACTVWPRLIGDGPLHIYGQYWQKVQVPTWYFLCSPSWACIGTSYVTGA